MLVAITQRRTALYGGADLLESAYARYFNRLGAGVVPIPNCPFYVERHLPHLAVHGVVFTGGGDIMPSRYGGRIADNADYSHEREETERALLQMAVSQALPVFGICRGMQALNVMFGGTLTQDLEHAGFNVHRDSRHEIVVHDDRVAEALGSPNWNVNSFHNHGIQVNQLAPRLTALASAPDGTVEAVFHAEQPIAGIMWHPEREPEPDRLGELLIRAFLDRTLFWSSRSRSRNPLMHIRTEHS